VAAVIERTTVGVEITFKDANGAVIPVNSMSAFRWELHSLRPGATNPVLFGTTLPAANPHVIVLLLNTLDVSVVGDRLALETKLTYDSAVLGVGAIARSEPFLLNLANSRISA
jgi:hypothetical protein